MEVIENVKSKNMWPTTTYTFTVNNIDNEYIINKVLEREQKGLGFRFDPIQGGGWPQVFTFYIFNYFHPQFYPLTFFAIPL